jgi:hypothetical protein
MTHVLNAMRRLLVAATLFGSFTATAAPRTFLTALNCQVTSITGGIYTSGVNGCGAIQANSKITLTCDSGPLEIYWLMPTYTTVNPNAQATLFLAQINNSLNLGKRFQSITYFPQSYSFGSPISDGCEENRLLLGLSTSGQANLLIFYKL